MVMRKGKRSCATTMRSAARTAKGRTVTFTLQAPDASEVMLAGDFNNWQGSKTPLKKGKNGWQKKIVLKPGKYEYKFVVDGNWINDPNNSWCVTNSYGSQNSVIQV